MLVEFVTDLGPWSWIILGVLLLALEILLPGFYLLWIGIAALLTGTLTFQLAEWAMWSWQVQVLVFLVLSVGSALVGRRLFSNRAEETDQPLLNRREQQLIGSLATLEEAIRDGHGRIRIGDTLWRVSGPDLPVGARVRVTGASGGELTVEQA